MADDASKESSKLAKRDRRRREWAQTIPSLLIILAIGALGLTAYMTIKTYRTDQQIGTLRHDGAAVPYALTSCDVASDATAGLVCTGDFQFQGRTYSENLSGVLNPPKNGQTVAAITNPRSPGAYVYVRTAVFGPNAAGRSAWYTGLIVMVALALMMFLIAVALISRNRRREPAVDPKLNIPDAPVGST